MAQPEFHLGFSLRKLTCSSPFLVFFLIFLQISDSFGQECVRCDDFNREKVKECALNYDECGLCKSGFIEDPDDKRLCFAIELLESSENIIKEKGSDVYLPCKFNAGINCVWTKDGTEMNIGSNDNCKWSNEGDGTNTDDCSISIEALSFNEVGQWQCSNKANSEYDSIKSNVVEVSIIAKVEKHPESIYRVGSGEAVVVMCQFDQAVKCSWMKNGRPIKSRDNYRFNEKEKTRDCALTINSFDANKDQGNWTCLTPGNSESQAIVANTAILRSDPNSVKNAPKYTLPTEIKSKSKIFYKNQNVNRKILELSSFGSKNPLNDLRCSAESVDVVSLSWLVHDDVEYPGLRIDNSIFVDQTLTNNIFDRLNSHQNVELFCLVKFSNKQTELATVTIVKSDQAKQLGTANINTLLIVLIVVIVVLMGGILAAVIGLACYFMRKQRKENSKSYFETNSNRSSTSSQSKLINKQTAN